MKYLVLDVKHQTELRSTIYFTDELIWLGNLNFVSLFYNGVHSRVFPKGVTSVLEVVNGTIELLKYMT
jgi:hypothetical protein